MSQFVGFKCDRCGAVYTTGIIMSGDKKAEVQCGKARRAYRFDLCNDCYDEFMAFSKREKQTKDRRLLDAALEFANDIQQANNLVAKRPDREICQLMNNALVKFANRKIAIVERDEP